MWIARKAARYVGKKCDGQAIDRITLRIDQAHDKTIPD